MKLFKLKNSYLFLIFVLPFILLNSYSFFAPIFLFISLFFLYSLYQVCKLNYMEGENKIKLFNKLRYSFIFLIIYGIVQFIVINKLNIEINSLSPIISFAAILYNIIALIVFILFIIYYLRINCIIPSFSEIVKHFFLFVLFPIGIFYLKIELNKKMITKSE